MDFFIREIEENDYIKIAKLYKKLRLVWAENMFSFYSKKRKLSKIKSYSQIVDDVIIKKYKTENSKFLVLLVDNKLVWFIYWKLFFPENEIFLWIDYIWWELCHLYIDEEYRWKWFSTKLRDKLFEWFKENNVDIMEIWVNQDNPSYKIYKKWWFESKYCCVNKEL